MALWDQYKADNGVIFSQELAAKVRYGNGTAYFDDL